MEWIYREVEGYSRPEKHCEPIQHNFMLILHTILWKQFSQNRKVQILSKFP